jgi:hypothetical protein
MRPPSPTFSVPIAQTLRRKVEQAAPGVQPLRPESERGGRHHGAVRGVPDVGIAQETDPRPDLEPAVAVRREDAGGRLNVTVARSDGAHAIALENLLAHDAEPGRHAGRLAQPLDESLAAGGLAELGGATGARRPLTGATPDTDPAVPGRQGDPGGQRGTDADDHDPFAMRAHAAQHARFRFPAPRRRT